MKNPYIRTFWYDKVNKSGFFMLDQRIPQVFTLTPFLVDFLVDFNRIVPCRISTL